MPHLSSQLEQVADKPDHGIRIPFKNDQRNSFRDDLRHHVGEMFTFKYTSEDTVKKIKGRLYFLVTNVKTTRFYFEKGSIRTLALNFDHLWLPLNSFPHNPGDESVAVGVAVNYTRTNGSTGYSFRALGHTARDFARNYVFFLSLHLYGLREAVRAKDSDEIHRYCCGVMYYYEVLISIGQSGSLDDNIQVDSFMPPEARYLIISYAAKLAKKAYKLATRLRRPSHGFGRK